MWLNKRKFKRLAKARITGSIAPGEEAVLDKLLEESETERREFQRIQELEKQLNSIRITDESIDVTEKVMQTIKSKTNTAKSFSPNTFSVENLFPTFPVRFAMILLAGIFIGSALTWVFIPGKSGGNTESLAGSLSANPNQSISYSTPNSNIRMIPYQIENMHYLNFIVETGSELQFKISYNDSEMVIANASYLAAEGNKSTSYDTGNVSFSATGRTTFQIIFEKVSDPKTALTVTALQNQSVIISKQLFFE